MFREWLISLSVIGCFFYFLGVAGAAEFCVDPGGAGTHISLKAALDESEINGFDDVIKVVQGTYNDNFSYGSAQGKNITIEGGYTPECASREVNPALTILDGNNSDFVLYVDDHNGGDITVDGFSLQNGNALAGGGVWANSSSNTASGDITISNNVITNNSAAGDGGGVFARSESSPGGVAGTVILNGNIISANSADTAGGVYARSYSPTGTAGAVILTNNTIIENSANAGGGIGGGVFASSYSVSGTPGTVTLTSNTIVSNTSLTKGGGVYMYAYSSSIAGGTINCYNNIIYGNTSVSGGDIFLGGDGTRYGYSNNFSTIAGTWNGGSANNIDSDPLFVDPLTGDYHLKSSSPCIDTGDNSAPMLPDFDFEGDDRKIDGNNDSTIVVDMGVDEFVPDLDVFSWPMFLPAITKPTE